ncbi:VanZ family protein [Kocuria marina]|uniref:VanZ family protein n=1 Tax=Kocuria marina TaxID=223184 RepID=UPI00119D063C|nr:VanZ family protein [Kocuria indica]
MRAQIFASVAVGLAVSTALFLPLVLWQFRRYGRFDALRVVWTAAGFTYAAGLVAFTVFPLPRFEPGYCAAHSTHPLLDPLRFPREVLEVLEVRGPLAVAGDWVVWEFALNMVLFVPFGLIVRRVLEWPRPAVFGAAVAVTVLIELTQGTGNWGLAPCPYRFADVTDLFTNSFGALIGIGLERLMPRLMSTKAHLLAQRDRARPVTRTRRLLGMALDTWYLVMSAVAGGVLAAALYTALNRTPDGVLSPAQLLELECWIFTGAWFATLLVALIPAVVSTGSSLGQRTVYLRPRAQREARIARLLRAGCVQAAVPTLLYAGFPWALLGPVLASAAVIAVAVDPRGLSYRLAGLDIADARQPALESESARR